MSLKLDSKTNAKYFRITEGKSAYSVEIEAGVIADYDERGAVLGVEVAYGKNLNDPDFGRLVALANRSTKGPRRMPDRKIPSID
jgi:uncharacterized protein YuzE